MYIKFKVGDIDGWIKLDVQDAHTDIEDADVVVSFRAGCIWCRIPASQHGSYAATPKYKYKPIQAEIQTQIYTEYNNNCELKIAMNQKWTVAW